MIVSLNGSAQVSMLHADFFRTRCGGFLFDVGVRRGGVDCYDRKKRAARVGRFLYNSSVTMRCVERMNRLYEQGADADRQPAGRHSEWM